MYYHKINQSFLEKVHQKNEQKAKESAKKAKEICYKMKMGLWEAATVGEANLHLEPEKSITYFKIAIQNNIKTWQVISMYRQAEILCEVYNLTNVSNELYTLFTGIKLEAN